ncbi:MAG: RNA 2',3'-cyclic phosphodiesterase [Usitatibacter sp.]
MARLFFALWPDAQAAEGLESLARNLAADCGGKPVPASKIHLTLAFLGEVPEDRLAEAASVAIRADRFSVVLDCVGSFRAARVAWAGATQPARELLALQLSLATQLRARGFLLEDRAFAPHVTLARRISKPAPRSPIDPIAWKASEVALVRTQAGSYTTLEAFSLGNGGR